jgi:hypothetical protein
MRLSGSMIRATSRDKRSEAPISRTTGSYMSTNSARTWAPVAVEPSPPVRRRDRSRACTKLPRKHGESEPLAARRKASATWHRTSSVGQHRSCARYGVRWRCPQFPRCNHDRSSMGGEGTETTASNRWTEARGRSRPGWSCSSTPRAAG